MNKKFILVMMLVAAFSVLLVGCANKEKVEVTTNTPVENTQEVPPPPPPPPPPGFAGSNAVNMISESIACA
jgi:hypothetical protein